MSRQASGFRAWLVQRISATYLGLYFIYAILYVLFFPPDSYQDWRDWVSDPFQGVGLMLFFAALLIHAWIGVRDVLIDYVHPIMVRIGLLTLTALCLIGSGLWVARVIFLGTSAV